MPAVLRPQRPPARPLAGLAALLGLKPAAGRPGDGADPAGRTITGITHDSRQVQPGDLYAALPGAQQHGARFAADAARAGAAGVLTDPAGRDLAAGCGLPMFVVTDPRARLGEVASWVYGHPSGRLALTGVTGTSGKTTTSYLIEAGLRAAGHRTGLIGGVQTRVAGQAVPSQLTTPEATDLQACLAVMAERGVTAAAMEVSSHALALGRVAGTSFEVAVFTNLSQDHLDFHADMDDYFAAKAQLFTPGFARSAVVNTDDAHGRKLAAAPKIPTTTYSAAGYHGADWRAVGVRAGADGSTFRVIGPGGVSADVSLALPGEFNVANALAAIVALVESGTGLAVAVAGVGSCTGVPGRLERVGPGQDPAVLVDYSHKPGAVEAVLTALRPVTAGALTIVLGCGGDRDRAKRPLMGAAAARLADTAIFTSDNPRSEDPLAILDAMLSGALTVPPRARAHVVVEPDRAAAIGLAIARAGPGDIVLIAGKGHETGQYVGPAVIPFDDREVAAEALSRQAAGREMMLGGPAPGAGRGPRSDPEDS
ncbi:MAG TPA: UDP-N-acetylmuramoyl-L-alanyl-D-glutamate--2,6-diaminopimelate ligase [Streptosporangiaceae bacterium]|nr:UDP-N-acetylmuramoyl-L-alanyl-D-glutamate--2,6-diaminopimelate ligase [Streptosporangiaceae bacterium]